MVFEPCSPVSDTVYLLALPRGNRPGWRGRWLGNHAARVARPRDL